VMYLYGKGVEKDGYKAEAWLSRAAEAGQVSAQSILGMMYATGAGVPKNPQKAQKWLYKAAGEGDKQAIQMLDLLGHDAGAVRL
ncbi:MAG: tetratricopeptide repeat protein, partial [Gammaproteobacteria bacterium]